MAVTSFFHLSITSIRTALTPNTHAHIDSTSAVDPDYLCDAKRSGRALGLNVLTWSVAAALTMRSLRPTPATHL